MKKILYIYCCTVLLLWGRSDALVIGVGQYEVKKYALDGIGYDLQNIKRILDRLDVPEKQTTVLKDKEATLSATRQAFQDYIHSPYNKKGNVFVFYYTGHGLQVVDQSGDEQRQKTLFGETKQVYDEAFAMYDLGLVEKEKSKKIEITKGILLDDEMKTILSQIESKKILIFDKCHSASSYRSLLSGFEKTIKQTFYLSASFAKDIVAHTKQNSKLSNFIALMATKEDQLAETSPLGGLFTQSLVQGIVYNKAQKGSKEMCFDDLRIFCQNNIQTLAQYYRDTAQDQYKYLKGAFNPVFEPYSLLSEPLTKVLGIKYTNTSQMIESQYLLEDILEGLVKYDVIKPTLKRGKKVYRLRDKIRFDFMSTKEGYLNVLLVYKDSYKLFTKNWKIEKEKSYKFPKSFVEEKSLRAQEPLGKTKIFLILSKKPWEIEKYIRTIKSDDMDLVHNITKQLMPSVEMTHKNVKDIVVVEKKRKRQKPNILTVSKVEFVVTEK